MDEKKASVLAVAHRTAQAEVLVRREYYRFPKYSSQRLEKVNLE